MGFAAALAPILPYLSAGASIVSAISGAAGASAQAQDQVDQAAYTRRQAEGAAQDEMIASAQEEAARRRELNSTLSTIDAIRASRGLSLSSPGAKAYAKNVGNIASDNIRIGKLNRLTRAGAYNSQAAFAARQGKSAARAGQIGVYTSLLGGVMGAGSALQGTSIFGSSKPLYTKSSVSGVIPGYKPSR